MISITVGPLTSFLDADKDISSTMVKYGGQTSPTPGSRPSTDSLTRGHGGVRFTDRELKVLR